ncbi:sigma factor-like helix-turn-helix DNA-binding protein [Streptomyces chumphonensis]|uniref:RNA polymerase subunit sigma-70 n=1 Tax=Streptomyces chumphonensis TaxID=1214925 RepID=A0A927IDV1_9ACTN|nr:sigma factor-like helix-turn-helix DNA-binding protein [Streptomyces chumphonensis]MBD3933512.1 RNA polymerase subunit sigma-70 [Streptomyces chumphonensis]
MGTRRAAADRRRAREFETFTAGAAGRLLHVAALLTGENPTHCPAAERLLTAALADTYAAWDTLRGEDPYACARTALAARFGASSWRHRRPRGGVLTRLGTRERLVLVLRLHEGLGEDQTAATLDLPPDRVRALYAHALSTMRSRPVPAPHVDGAAR